MKLVVVESPAKAKTISGYLGKDYKVLASFGHVRDLPSKNGSVDPERKFAMNYQLKAEAKKHVDAIVAAAKKSNQVLLASDPDREGEAISWNIAEILKEKKVTADIKRITFNEITKKSVTYAAENPRDIDQALVNAQQARLCLDYLVGFNLSPVLWRKLPGSKSAGRVQSVALRMIAEREEEIENFVSQEYWTIRGAFASNKKEKFYADLVELDGKKLEKNIANEASCNEVLERLKSGKEFTITDINESKVTSRPDRPYNTSSLQQDAANRLYFTSKKTMNIAQKLYEGVEINGEVKGLITYMRTDGVSLSGDAIEMVRNHIKTNYPAAYLPAKPNIYQTKTKNAQEAHEAIRPTDASLTPALAAKFLDNDQLKLYSLIWYRTVMSQMSDALYNRTQVSIVPNHCKALFRTTGSVIVFDGYVKLKQELATTLAKARKGAKEDEEEDGDNKKENDADTILPALKQGEKVDLDKLLPKQSFTQPPARYNEASLVKKLEESGIGRPSTYASIISVLQERQYVRLDKRRFFLESRGRLVSTFLVHFFTKYVEYDFTAELEEELDLISDNKIKKLDFLNKFWGSFFAQVQKVSTLNSVTEIIPVLNEKLHKLISSDPEMNCPTCKDGKLSLKIGRYGVFVGCSAYPTCSYTNKLDVNDAPSDGEESSGEDRAGKKEKPKTFAVGLDENGKEISVKFGMYGYYVEVMGLDEKVKRSSIPKYIPVDTITLDMAKSLLSLPRKVGVHPDTKLPIVAGIGRFGDYVLHNKMYASLKGDDNALNVGINRAVELIALKEAAPPREKRAGGFKKTATKKTSTKTTKDKTTKSKATKK